MAEYFENIVKHDVQVSRNMPQLVEVIQSNSELLSKSLDYSLLNEKDSWHAAWAIFHYTETTNDFNLISDNSLRIIKTLPDIKKDGQLRELLKTLIKLNLNEEEEGLLTEFCFEICLNPKKQGSVRWKCYDFLVKICDKYPELIREVILVGEEIKPTVSKGFAYCLAKSIIKLEKIEKITDKTK